MTRDITVVTGTRAEYGLLRSSMEGIQGSDGLSLSVIATGMHLSPEHGHTVDNIRNDGFEVDHKVHMLLEGDSGLAMAKSLGVGTAGLAEALGSLDPDVVLVLGDRDEALAAGMAAAHMNIPVAHVHGGDAMQGAIIDDSIRHALTKFAHLHFPATKRSRERIVKLGEEEWRITTVGAPGLDDVLSREYEDGDAVREKYGVPLDRRLVLVVQHPVTTQADRAGEQMRATLNAVAEVDARTIVIYPNADSGGKAMIEEIEDHPGSEGFTTFRSLPRREYLGFLEAADAIVGNSSSGIIEAPSFGLPVVDVGPRQESRERAENVITAPSDQEAIHRALVRCLEDKCIRRRARECENPYDKGGAAGRIVDRLESVELDDRLLRKRLTYE